MSKQVIVLVELTIAGNKISEVRDMLPAIIEKVKHTEPGTGSYQWYINESEARCYILEEFDDAGAWLAHLTNVEESLPALFALAPLTRWEAFGHVPGDIREKVQAMGAVLHEPLAGFNRR
jgi:quinol monooxygenase YgiN